MQLLCFQACVQVHSGMMHFRQENIGKGTEGEGRASPISTQRRTANTKRVHSLYSILNIFYSMLGEHITATFSGRARLHQSINIKWNAPQQTCWSHPEFFGFNLEPYNWLNCIWRCRIKAAGAGVTRVHSVWLSTDCLINISYSGKYTLATSCKAITKTCN